MAQDLVHEMNEKKILKQRPKTRKTRKKIKKYYIDKYRNKFKHISRSNQSHKILK